MGHSDDKFIAVNVYISKREGGWSHISNLESYLKVREQNEITQKWVNSKKSSISCLKSVKWKQTNKNSANNQWSRFGTSRESVTLTNTYSNLLKL